jgi:hypothetical protein
MDKKNLYENALTHFNVRYGVVTSLESSAGPIENKGLGRIKVRIKGSMTTGGDDSILDENLPWCFPLMPKHFSVQPKVGEVVLLFVFSKQQQHVDRLYIGPIISQLPKLNEDPFLYSALNGFSFGVESPLVNTAQIPDLNGVFANPEDVVVQGRYNTDIIQKKNEVLIRAGKFVPENPTSNNPYPFKFNSSSQAYIQLKNNIVTTPKTNQQPERRGSITNIVANKINLLTHADGSPRFDLTNPDNLISDEEMTRILTEAHQLPFGDVLLEYLKLMKDALFSHVHNGSGNPPTDLTISGNKQALAAFKSKADSLEKAMLSRNVRIN